MGHSQTVLASSPAPLCVLLSSQLYTTHRHNKGTQADRHTDTQTHRHILDFSLYKLDMLCILCHCRTSHITIKCFFQGLGSPYFYISIVPMFSKVKKKKKNLKCINYFNYIKKGLYR